MKKIRINELARQLEMPSHEILDMLPELGVTEKKTHSSSIDEDVADKIRDRISGSPVSNASNNGAALAEAPPEQEAQPADNHRGAEPAAAREQVVEAEPERARQTAPAPQ